MKIYEERNNKRDFQCSYCYHEGHNKRHCPHMKAQWDANPQVHETYDHDSLVGIDKTMFPTHYQRFWHDDDARRQFRNHWRYMVNRFSTKTKAPPKKRKKTRCGFCGSTAHTRRNCNKLKNFVYVLNETNKAYRSRFYDKFIDGMGLGAGALVSLRNHDGNSIALITSFPTEKIMFTNLLRSWTDYHTRATVGLNVNGETYNANLGNDILVANVFDPEVVESLGVWKNMYSQWGRLIGVVSPAPKKPTKEWFVGQAPCYEWIVKKRDQTTIMSVMSHLIKEFYPHNNLRSKLGAKTYDAFYVR